MKKPYQVVVDVWEGNPDFDPRTLMENGVSGCIVRLNDMNGGHHMDQYFEQNWAKAKLFPIQSLYFVYNPWVNGGANYEWLMANLPSDFGDRRIFIDIEVRYPGYSPAAYAKETKLFCDLVRKIYRCSRYSGGGFIDILTPWPVDEEYWWASYSYTLTYRSFSWASYYHNLEGLIFDAYTEYCPGTCKMLQMTGDGLRLDGFGNHAVDTNIILGTLDEAASWFGCDLTEKEPEVSDTYPPMGLFTKEPGWSNINAEYDFIVGLAQTEFSVEPNNWIKPIQEEAEKFDKPFMLWWEHYPWAYSEEQWGQSNWPTEDADYIFQKFKGILEARSYEGVVISIGTFLNRQKKEEMPAFVAFSSKQFIDRVQGWLHTNRPTVPLIVATSNEFISRHAPDINNWVHNFPNMAVETTALANSYPMPGLKPAYLGASEECAWWRYWEMSKTALIVFRGEPGYPPDVEGMCRWLNISSSIPDEEVPPDNSVDPEVLTKATEYLLDINSDISEIQELLEQTKATVGYLSKLFGISN